jgi:hypothetical protein
MAHGLDHGFRPRREDGEISAFEQVRGCLGGAVMGIGMTMLEEIVFDPDTGRVANATVGRLPDSRQRRRA